MDKTILTCTSKTKETMPKWTKSQTLQMVTFFCRFNGPVTRKRNNLNWQGSYFISFSHMISYFTLLNYKKKLCNY